MYNDNKNIDLFGGESMERNHFVNIGEQRFEIKLPQSHWL